MRRPSEPEGYILRGALWDGIAPVEAEIRPGDFSVLPSSSEIIAVIEACIDQHRPVRHR